MRACVLTRERVTEAEKSDCSAAPAANTDEKARAHPMRSPLSPLGINSRCVGSNNRALHKSIPVHHSAKTSLRARAMSTATMASQRLATPRGASITPPPRLTRDKQLQSILRTDEKLMRQMQLLEARLDRVLELAAGQQHAVPGSNCAVCEAAATTPACPSEGGAGAALPGGYCASFDNSTRVPSRLNIGSATGCDGATCVSPCMTDNTASAGTCTRVGTPLLPGITPPVLRNVSMRLRDLTPATPGAPASPACAVSRSHDPDSPLWHRCHLGTVHSLNHNRGSGCAAHATTMAAATPSRRSAALETGMRCVSFTSGACRVVATWRKLQALRRAEWIQHALRFSSAASTASAAGAVAIEKLARLRDGVAEGYLGACLRVTAMVGSSRALRALQSAVQGAVQGLFIAATRGASRTVSFGASLAALFDLKVMPLLPRRVRGYLRVYFRRVIALLIAMMLVTVSVRLALRSRRVLARQDGRAAIGASDSKNGHGLGHEVKRRSQIMQTEHAALALSVLALASPESQQQSITWQNESAAEAAPKNSVHS